MPVIKRFISGVEESGKYSGFCTLGVSCQATENIQLRECFGMRPEMTGVLVSRINPLSDAYKILKKDDILLEFDGVPIANDGTGKFLHMHQQQLYAAYFVFSFTFQLPPVNNIDTPTIVDCVRIGALVGWPHGPWHPRLVWLDFL